MNTKQIHYVLALAETLSFSQVAGQFGITQPALSKQIQHIEKELGVRLFERSPSQVKLTAAGEHFVKGAKEILIKEEQLLRTVSQYQSGERGTLTIGVTPFRSAYLMPSLVKRLREKFSGLQVRLCEAGSEVLRREAAEGKFDFAVINLPVDEALFDVRPIEQDRLVLVMHSDLTKGRAFDGVKEIDFADCKDLPFVAVGPTQEMRAQLEALCLGTNVQVDIAAEVVGLTTAWQMARKGVGATLLPRQFVRGQSGAENMLIFDIKNSTYERTPAIVVRKGQPLSRFAKEAIRLLQD